MKRTCKGCGRKFETMRANVRFHSNECRIVQNRIRAAEKTLAFLKTQMDEIRLTGALSKKEKLVKNSTGFADPYFVPPERFRAGYEPPEEFSTDFDLSTTAKD